MAVLTLTGFADTEQVWLPSLFVLDPTDPTIILTATETTVTVTATSQYVQGPVTITVAGYGFTYFDDGSGEQGWPLSGYVESITLEVARQVWMTATELAIELPDLDHFMFGWERFGMFRPGNGFDFFSLMLGGDDTINGSDNGDDIIGGRNTGNDLINAGAGFDYISADAGNDTIYGGTEQDTYSLSESFFDGSAYRGAVVNLATGLATDCWGGADVLESIEEVRGSRLADRFIGSGNDEQFAGLRGNDAINGGGGFDIVRYDRDEEFGGQLGVTVDLALRQATDGWGNTDTLRAIEGAIGTARADSFIGDRADNYFSGGLGADTFQGGAGRDTVDFYMDFQSVGAVVNLGRATGQVRNDGHGNIESLAGIEDLWGTRFADSFIGDRWANFLFGDAGNDTLVGGGGNDTLEGSVGADRLTGGAGADSFQFSNRFSDGDPWGDTITDFVSGTDRLTFMVNDFAGMAEAQFQIGTEAGSEGQGWFFFHDAADQLFWDADGIGGEEAVLVAYLNGVDVLVWSDFDLI